MSDTDYGSDKDDQFHSEESNSESENDADDATFEVRVTRLLTPYMKINLVSTFVNSLVEAINKWKLQYKIPEKGVYHYDSQLLNKEEQIIRDIKSNVKTWEHKDFIDSINHPKLVFLDTLVTRLLTTFGGRKKTRKSNRRVRNSKRVRTSKRGRSSKSKRGIKSKRTRS